MNATKYKSSINQRPPESGHSLPRVKKDQENNMKNKQPFPRGIVLFALLLLWNAQCGTTKSERRDAVTTGEQNMPGERLSRPEAELAKAEGVSDGMEIAPRPNVGPAYRRQSQESNTEAYSRIYDNTFQDPKAHPLSTFSIDVDTASYSNVRRFLGAGQMPPKDAVRIEELVNYFNYDYDGPSDARPFAVRADVASCPWDNAHRLVRIGIQGRKIAQENLPPRNLVFLLDVSGSMMEPNKLPLLKQSLKMLTETLTEKDHVAIVVYAGSSGLVLPPTAGNDRPKILEALSQLEAGGSTNGAEGIQLAYKVMRENFHRGGINRVILATDGDFNVGMTSEGDLIRLIEKERESGVYLTVLGFGYGNLKDSTMEQLADKGNGNYAYIDNLSEARKVLVEQAGGTLVTIAKDVKLQVEFNPAKVSSYRLIGYENRMLRDEDFNDDTKDAGEIGAGHTVTALYEIVPVGVPGRTGNIDPLRYQQTQNAQTASSGELMNVKIRYKAPDSNTSELISFVVPDSSADITTASPDFRFAASVAAFGMVLRDSEFKGQATLEMARRLAESGRGRDERGYRAEFIRLIQTASDLNH